ncbi:hypothetical protein GCM10008106_27390 [Mongoliitalea lutea]|uniref:WG containing repeat-containing protein n=2 Tax=Mongoliitalea lutea TaxID=849756 RepID=A0A8J3CYK8_9BACT|nr:hypothetical protein GCM10008106_27390 [Mongoliitalea lutea]
MVDSMKKVEKFRKLLLLFFLSFILINKAYSQKGPVPTGKAQLFFNDGKSILPIPYMPIFNEAGEVEFLADIDGLIELPTDRLFYVRSQFYTDTVVQVRTDSLTKIILEYKDVALNPVEIKYFKDPRDQIKYLSKSINSDYVSSPHLGVFSGYSIVNQQGKVLGYFEAAGLSLLSGNKKWKPWDFAVNNSSGETYNHLLPMELRRSHHWNLAGDTIPSSYHDEKNPQNSYGLLPFYCREFYRALEVSGPLDEKSIKYYDFRYGDEVGNDVIYFNIKDQFKADDKLPIFLIGEGVIYLSNSGDMVERFTFNFSSYRYLNFELKRDLRNRGISGILTVVYDRYDGKIFPKEIELEAKFFESRNLFRPRSFDPGNEASIKEKLYLTNYQPLAKDDVQNLAQAMNRVGLESMVPYNSSYWRLGTKVSDKDFRKIQSDLGRIISLEKQFLANSGKRLHPWYNGETISSSDEEMNKRRIKYTLDVVTSLRSKWDELN